MIGANPTLTGPNGYKLGVNVDNGGKLIFNYLNYLYKLTAYLSMGIAH